MTTVISMMKKVDYQNFSIASSHGIGGNRKHLQGFHRLEKYLNILDCLEKSLKIKFALKSTLNTLQVLEIYHLQEDSTMFGDLNQYKSVVPLFGAAHAAPNKSTTILYYLKLISLVMD